MTSTTDSPHFADASLGTSRWPLGGLLVLAGAAFVTILTEALPAGVLPVMSADLHVTEARAGLLVTVYALAAALTAIPVTAWTLIVPRRTLLVALLLGFAATNAVTAVSADFTLTLGARIVSGVFAGLLWAMVPAYAARLAPEHSGKAIATALAGMTVGLSLGIPAGTALGGLIGWRWTFGLLTVLALALAAAALLRLPQLSGELARRGRGLLSTIRTPGIAAINTASIAAVLGFYVLYTYIAPFVERAGLGVGTGTVLFVFGLGSMGGIWVAGVTADRRLRTATLGLLTLATLCLASFGLFAQSTVAVLLGALLWGGTHGGIPTLMQTAGVRAAPQDPDTANSLWVTGWNIGMAGGSLLGGAVLTGAGTSALPWAASALLAVSVLTAALARRNGFPPAK
ncbi:MFS transporter [Streptomyces sp. ISL-112]|uniref:MFS transporter n=1 Tax=unclassified Streptomyces TaxID=2593676 RepID=UPI001BE5CE96|nr:MULTISPECIES: MFS transporter [unclassified Streptomyces]MBT2429657.1 MFS transporter [Streptomyces sp. ISL-112]MBT2464774.1 MFS transporter [Streptomyces sp. ISL-63]